MLAARREVHSADLALPEACPLAGNSDTTIGSMEERNRIFYLSPPRAFRETIYTWLLVTTEGAARPQQTGGGLDHEGMVLGRYLEINREGEAVAS